MMEATLSLRMVRCIGCGRIDLPTASLCAKCLGRELVQQHVSGAGKLVAWTTIRRAPLKFRDQTPYIVCVVDLEGGQRITGRLQSAEDATVGVSVLAVAIESNTYLFSLN